MDSSNSTHFKPEIEKDKVLDFIPSQNSVRQSRAMCVIDDDENKDEVTAGIDREEEKKKEMVKQVISEGFHKKKDSEEPISQIQNVVKKNQEPVGKGSTESDDSFIAEEKNETQQEISSKDSAKEQVCQVHSMSHFENVAVKMNSEGSSRIEGKQEEVFQVQDVITESSASGSNNKGMAAEIGTTHITNGNVCARKETMSSIALGKKGAGICSENIRQQKSDGSKQSYLREEMEVLRG
ncbi:hypothetical protein MKX01_027520 [Papaver californicum]|nr:hypothetical protein MKX01_027520 [Papaver californicum]